MLHPQVKLDTSKGIVIIELYPEHAPKTVENFIKLVKNQFYDGLAFHRAIKGFLIQTGCPKGDGAGGPGYTIPCECDNQAISHDKPGVIAMAHAGRNTGGSQFYITLAPQPHLDHEYTIFGQVIEGLDATQRLIVGDIIKEARMNVEESPVPFKVEELTTKAEIVVQESDKAEEEPLEEILTVMDRIRTALAEIGTDEKTSKVDSSEKTTLKDSTITFSKGLNTIVQEATESEQSKTEILTSSDQQLQSPSEKLSSEPEPEILFPEEYPDNKIPDNFIETTSISQDDFLIDSTEKAQELLGTISETEEFYATKPKTKVEDPTPPSETVPEEMSSVMHELQQINHSLEELAVNQIRITRISSRTLATFVTIKFLLLGVISFEIISILVAGYTHSNLFDRTDLFLVNIFVISLVIALWALLVIITRFLWRPPKQSHE